MAAETADEGKAVVRGGGGRQNGTWHRGSSRSGTGHGRSCVEVVCIRHRTVGRVGVWPSSLPVDCHSACSGPAFPLLLSTRSAGYAGVCLSAKLRKDSAKGHAAETETEAETEAEAAAAAAAVAEGVGARTLFYALHALRRKVLIGSTQHNPATAPPPHSPGGSATEIAAEAAFVHKTAANDEMRNMLTATTAAAACTCHSYLCCCHALLLSLSLSLPLAWTSIKRGHIESTQNNCFLNGFYAICDIHKSKASSPSSLRLRVFTFLFVALIFGFMLAAAARTFLMRFCSSRSPSGKRERERDREGGSASA